MARLSEGRVAALLERLTQEERPQVSARTADDERHRRDLSAIATRGDLGPLLAQRLAAYLHRPVGCVSAATAKTMTNPATYAEMGDSGFWIAFDALLAAAIADAMIGGEGDPARLGVGSKAMGLATSAAAQLLEAIAGVLETPAPKRVQHTASESGLGAPLGGGVLSLGSREYAFAIGKKPAQAQHQTQAPAQVRKTRPALPQERELGSSPGSLGAAFDAARACGERLLGAAFAFGEPHRRRALSAQLPTGWVRMGLAARSGTVILSVDETTGAHLLRPLVGEVSAQFEGRAPLAQAGVETIVTQLLRAFIATLEGNDEGERRVLALTGDAMLAATPHEAIDHAVEIAGRTGRFIWLVPSALVRA